MAKSMTAPAVSAKSAVVVAIGLVGTVSACAVALLWKRSIKNRRRSSKRRKIDANSNDLDKATLRSNESNGSLDASVDKVGIEAEAEDEADAGAGHPIEKLPPTVSATGVADIPTGQSKGGSMGEIDRARIGRVSDTTRLLLERNQATKEINKAHRVRRSIAGMIEAGPSGTGGGGGEGT